MKKYLVCLLTLSMLLPITIYLSGCSKSSADITESIEELCENHRSSMKETYGNDLSTLKVTSVNLTQKEAEENGFNDHISDGYTTEYSKHTSSACFDGMLASNAMGNIWYPGAILKLSYQEEEDNKFVASSLSRTPINISASLESVSGIQSEGLIATIENPANISDTRMAVNKIVSNIFSSNVDIPVNLTCNIIEVNQNESLDTAVGMSVGFGGFGLDTSLGFSKDNKRTKAILALKQIYFSIDADRPINAKDAFKNVTKKQFQNEFNDGSVPVYCSVVYGRIALVAIETDMSMVELKASLRMGYTNIFELKTNLEKIYQDNQTSMFFYLYGGSSSSSNALSSSNMNEFINLFNNTELGAPLPIGYRFYYLDDGTLAKISMYSEYYTKQLLPIRISDFSFSMKRNSDGKVTDMVQPGDVLNANLFIEPETAIIYDVKYKINSCLDYDDHPYAEINPDTGRLRVFENAVPGETIKVTATLTQKINGEPYEKIRSVNLLIKERPVEKVILDPLEKTSIFLGETVTIFSSVFPKNVSDPSLNWIVNDGPGIFRNPLEGKLSLTQVAKIGDKIHIHAVSKNGISSNVLEFTVVDNDKKTLNLTLTTEDNLSYATGGMAIRLFTKLVPDMYDLDESLISYTFLAGEDVATIIDGVLYIKETAEPPSVIKIMASDITGAKSNILTITIMSGGRIRDDEEKFSLIIPYHDSIKNVEINVLDGNGISIEKCELSSGQELDLINFGKNYFGLLRFVCIFHLKNDNKYTQEIFYHSHFVNGTGTSNNPYIIKTTRHFFNIKLKPEAYFILKNDLEVDNGNSWISIPNFKGVLDGNNHRIKFNCEILVNLKAQNEIQFGGIADNNYGKICNLTLENLVYKSKEYYHEGRYFVSMGGVVGMNHKNAIIDNVVLKNPKITCDRNNSASGSVCGVNKGLISNVTVTDALMYATGDGGGISGRIQGGTITNAKFSGEIGIYITLNNGDQCLRSWGGIVGYVFENNSVIKNCNVESCIFKYYGEENKYHNWFHAFCNLQISVGIVAGNVDEDCSTVTDCKYEDEKCPKSLKVVGGNFHYGSYEKKNLFSRDDGMIGQYY